ncbi:MAG: hypothetical protein B7X02_01295, partial [Rhodospirillales bacterium 12-54-5]
MQRLRRFVAFFIASTACVASSAYAWNPNSGADPAVITPSSQQTGNLPSYVVPQRYYTPTYNPAAPAVSAPAPTAYVPAPAAPAPQPVATPAPAYAAPVAVATTPSYAAPVTTAPAY